MLFLRRWSNVISRFVLCKEVKSLRFAYLYHRVCSVEVTPLCCISSCTERRFSKVKRRKGIPVTVELRRIIEQESLITSHIHVYFVEIRVVRVISTTVKVVAIDGCILRTYKAITHLSITRITVKVGLIGKE